MPTPKDGTAGSAVAPAEAVAPEPADEADPGKIQEIKAEQIQAQTGKYGSQKVTPYKPPTAEEQEAAASQAAQQEQRQEQAVQKKADWIEIELVGMDDSPIAGMPYEIVLPDGKTVDKGTTDSKGKARLTGLIAGNCQITFPSLDQSAWEEIQPG